MFSRSCIDNIYFSLQKVKKLLLELDPYGGADPDGHFSLKLPDI